jgi:hypothetical protein
MLKERLQDSSPRLDIQMWMVYIYQHMAKNNNNFNSYLQKIKDTPMSRFNLPIPKKEELLSEALIEGHKLLAAEEKSQASKIYNTVKKEADGHKLKDDKKNLENKLAETSSNPYIRARREVLKKMSTAELDAIAKMEKGEIPKDSWYDRFVHKIAELGDQYSNQKL